jgi:hypothetical protein
MTTTAAAAIIIIIIIIMYHAVRGLFHPLEEYAGPKVIFCEYFRQ